MTRTQTLVETVEAGSADCMAECHATTVGWAEVLSAANFSAEIAVADVIPDVVSPSTTGAVTDSPVVD